MQSLKLKNDIDEKLSSCFVELRQDFFSYMLKSGEQTLIKANNRFLLEISQQFDVEGIVICCIEHLNVNCCKRHFVFSQNMCNLVLMN